MRVCFLHGSNDRYGASRVLVQDVGLLLGLGHEVVVVLPNDGPLTTQLSRLGACVTITHLAAVRKVDGVRALRLPLHAPVATTRADVTVVWTLALATYLPALAARTRSIICSVHEILPGAPGRTLAASALALSTVITTNSDATTRWLTRGRANHSVHRMYPAAPPYAPLPLVPSPPRSIRLLVAGRINGHKGHLEAIRAAEIARSRGINVSLTLLGAPFRGQERYASEVAALASSRQWAIFCDEVGDIRPHLARCDVMLVPTTRPEPFGLVALEAWAAGRRVIASDCGGLAEAARLVGGMTVPMGDVAALARQIELVAREPSIRQVPDVFEPASSVCSMRERRQAWKAILDGITSHRVDAPGSPFPSRRRWRSSLPLSVHLNRR